MAIYLGRTEVNSSGIKLGNRTPTNIKLGGTIVWPPDGVYTYALTNETVVYSNNGYNLLANRSNFAYIKGTYITYKNGQEISRQEVVCDSYPVTYGNDHIVKDNQEHYYWNYDKYKESAVTFSSIQYRVYYGSLDNGTKLYIYYGSNTNNSYISSAVENIKIGSYSGSTITLPSTYGEYPIEVLIRRYWGWTSGVIRTSTTFTGKRKYVNITSQVLGEQTQGYAVDSAYRFTNNATEDVDVVAYLEATVSWWDPEEQIQDQDTAYDYKTITVPAGGYTDVDLRAEVDDPGYPGSFGYSQYYYLDGVPGDTYVGASKTGTYDINGVYINTSGVGSFMTVSGLGLTVQANSTEGDRNGSVTVCDYRDTGNTGTVSIIQKATTYLTVSPNSVLLTYTAQTGYTTVYTNVSSWDILSTPAWATATKSGNRINYSVETNTGDASRTGNIIINGGSVGTSFRITQAKRERYQVLAINPDTCLNCGNCIGSLAPLCPTGCDIIEGSSCPIVLTGNCISCADCVAELNNQCPTTCFYMKDIDNYTFSVGLVPFLLSGTTAFTIDITSKNGDTLVPMSTSDYILSGVSLMGVACTSVSLVSGVYRYSFTCRKNTGASARSQTIIFTQPESGKELSVTVRQSSGGIEPIEL